jgi:hypothetical protein
MADELDSLLSEADAASAELDSILGDAAPAPQEYADDGRALGSPEFEAERAAALAANLITARPSSLGAIAGHVFAGQDSSGQALEALGRDDEALPLPRGEECIGTVSRWQRLCENGRDDGRVVAPEDGRHEFEEDALPVVAVAVEEGDVLPAQRRLPTQAGCE